MAFSMKQRGYNPLLNTPTAQPALGGTADSPTLTIDGSVRAFQVNLPIPSTTTATQQDLVVTVDTTHHPNVWMSGFPRIFINSYLMDNSNVAQQVQMEVDGTAGHENEFRVRRTSMVTVTGGGAPAPITGRLALIMEVVPRDE